MTTPENGIYVLQGIVPAAIAAAPVAVKVIDLYDDNGQLFTAAQVSQMEAGNSLLLGYFSIGEAENYRSYFSSLPTAVLGPVDPSWPGDYEVAYWTAAWQTVCTNYIDQMITQGYGGAFLDVVSECETAWAKANAPGGDATGAMVSLIQYLANYAHAKDPSFKIWVNSSGAEDLMANSAFVNTIDGAYEEGLFYKDNGFPQLTADINYNLVLLNNLVAAGKPIIAIEYVTDAATVAAVQAKAAADGIGSYIANPNRALNGVDTEGFATLGTPPPPPTDVLTPHAITIAPATGQIFSGTVATFTDSNTSITASGLTATINWGDGTSTTAGVVTGGSGSFT